MLKKSLKIISSGLFYGLISSIITLLCLLIWIKIQPRDIDFLKSYILEKSNSYLPKNATLNIDNVQLHLLNGYFKPTLNLNKIKLNKEQEGVAGIENIAITADLPSIFDSQDHSILHIEVQHPSFNFKKSNSDSSAENTKNLPFQKINSYIRKNKKWLEKLDIDLIDLHTHFIFSENEELKLDLNSIKFTPIPYQDSLFFELTTDLKFGQTNHAIKLKLDTVSSDNLIIKLDAHNISSKLLTSLGLNIPYISDSTLNTSSLKAVANITSAKTIQNINFKLDGITGTIQKNQYITTDIPITNSSILGSLHSNFQELHLNNINLQSGNFKLAGSLRLEKQEQIKKLSGDLKIAKVDIITFKNYWPSRVLPRTKRWVNKVLLGGDITSKGKFSLSFKDKKIQKLKKGDLDLNFQLSNAKLQYLPEAPIITGVAAQVDIIHDKASVHAQNGKILGDDIEYDLEIDFPKRTLYVSGKHEGKVKNLLDIAYLHSKSDLIKEFTVNGQAQSSFSFHKDLQKSVTPIEFMQNFTFSSTMSELSAKHSGYNFTNGRFNTTLKDAIFTMEGSALVSQIDTDILLTHNLHNQRKKVVLHVDTAWDNIRNLGFTVPNYITNAVEAKVIINRTPKTLQTMVDIDLHKSVIKNKTFDITKKANEVGRAQFLFTTNKDKTTNVKKYDIKFGKLNSSGNMQLSKSHELLSLYSPSTKLHNGNFSISYKTEEGSKNLYIEGESLDLNALNLRELRDITRANISTPSSKLNKGQNFILNTNLKKIRFKNAQTILNPVFNIHCQNNKCARIVLKGAFDNPEKTSNLDLNFTHPNLSLKTNDAGATLAAFNLAKNVKEGTLSFEGSIDKKELFTGQLEIDKYYLKKTPLVAKLLTFSELTITPLEGIANLLNGRGMRFQKLLCPIKYNKGIIELSDCVAKGSSVVITAKGDIDLKKDKVGIKGKLIPENIINSTIKNIPILRNVLGGKDKKGAIATTYTITGTLDNMSANTNPLSILAPSFIKDILEKITESKKKNTNLDSEQK